MTSTDPRLIRFLLQQAVRFACIAFIVVLIYLTAIGEFQHEYKTVPIGALLLFGIFAIVGPAMTCPAISPIPLSRIKKGKGEPLLVKEYFSIAFFGLFILFSFALLYFLIDSSENFPHRTGILFTAVGMSILGDFWIIKSCLQGTIKSATLVVKPDSISIKAARDRFISRGQVKAVVIDDSLILPSILIYPHGESTVPLMDPRSFVPFLTVGPQKLAEEIARILDVPLKIIN